MSSELLITLAENNNIGIIGEVILLVILLSLFFSIGILMSLHAYLISINLTTHEQMRNLIKGKNPFDKGCMKNWAIFYKKQSEHDLTLIKEANKLVFN